MYWEKNDQNEVDYCQKQPVVINLGKVASRIVGILF